MTNIVAILTVALATNWTFIGTFHPLSGSAENVYVGNIVTNTTAVITYQGKRHELILLSELGASCGEKREPQRYYYDLPNWPYRGILLTNSSIFPFDTLTTNFIFQSNILRNSLYQ